LFVGTLGLFFTLFLIFHPGCTGNRGCGGEVDPEIWLAINMSGPMPNTKHLQLQLEKQH
jgi:hypothetical protein